MWANGSGYRVPMGLGVCEHGAAPHALQLPMSVMLPILMDSISPAHDFHSV